MRNVRVGVLNALKNEELASEFDLTGFPSFVLFVPVLFHILKLFS
jgi:thioredoxin-related protein